MMRRRECRPIQFTVEISLLIHCVRVSKRRRDEREKEIHFHFTLCVRDKLDSLRQAMVSRFLCLSFRTAHSAHMQKIIEIEIDCNQWILRHFHAM